MWFKNLRRSCYPFFDLKTAPLVVHRLRFLFSVNHEVLWMRTCTSGKFRADFAPVVLQPVDFEAMYAACLQPEETETEVVIA